MEIQKSKKDIIKQILKTEISDTDKEELINMLINEKTTVDVDNNANDSKWDKLADKITEIVGSWPFIIGMILFLSFWIILNTFFIKDADPYPFILLNLILSCVAALQAPIIMMSQNREAKRDRLRNSNDYKTDLKSELILEELHSKALIIINNQKELLKKNNEKNE